MPARELSPPLDSSFQQNIRILPDSTDYGTSRPSAGAVQHFSATNAPTRTLSTLSLNAMNALSTTSSTSVEHPLLSKPINGTIRSVPPDPIHTEHTASDEAPWRAQSNGDSQVIPSSPRLFVSIPTARSHTPPLSRQATTPIRSGIARNISTEFGLSKSHSSNNGFLLGEDGTVNGNCISPSLLSPDLGGPPGTSQWSSAVGRANLGKSGRVIERLMGENDMLKRDINIERLRAEENNQAVKMVEGRMEALMADYEGKLHDAAINKTLLKRRERQLSDLKAQITGEKLKAERAMESERGWRDAMEKLERESKEKVEEAQAFAMLMEGRNNALSTHWKEQGVEVNRTVSKLGEEIESIVAERRNDDSRMNMLQGLCDQQAKQLTSLLGEKEGIEEAFQRYKAEQEDALRDIKEKAKLQERANEEALEETRKVLGELKWALGVKKNVKRAE